MAQSLGSLCIVLHGHLPYVLNHGAYPHGEAWLYEAAVETYLPLLDVIGHCALNRARPGLTIGLTPILLEQLSHPRFKEGFVEYLNERMERARADKAEFDKAKQPHFAFLATRWEEWFASALAQFEKIKRDIPAEFAARWREGHVQLLTSNATHAYMPLLLNDEMLAAQMSAGVTTSKRILGQQPRGMWLPECAYRPEWGNWMPAVLFDNPRHRPGVETFIEQAGVTHFFVDTHLIRDGQPLGTFDRGQFTAVSPSSMYWDRNRGWNQPMSPVGVVSTPGVPKTFAFARHPRISEQVWSGKIGYPGDGVYMEFHRKHGDRGLRYHKITDNKSALSTKEPYYPDDIKGRLFEHATHFAGVVKQVLRDYKNETGREGVIVAPFDAELFGHWWFEGVSFLRDVILTINADPEIKLMTTEEALYNHPADKVMRMPEGSWGDSGDHRVWINDQNKWIWEMEYRAEGTFLRLLHSVPWKTSDVIRQHLTRTARELLLLQASDWPFVIHTKGALDYGIQRFSLHCTRFDRAARATEDVAAGKELTRLQLTEIAEIDEHDSVFADIDLNWWMR